MLPGDGRVPKDDPRIEACGSVDEANAAIGVARATGLPAEADAVLCRVQHDLFVLGAELAMAGSSRPDAGLPRLSNADIASLEQKIDAAERGLPKLSQFILPAGRGGAAELHQARTICRRAERRVLSAGRQLPLRAELLAYLNRLSDLLFVLARSCSQAAGGADEPWRR